MAEKKKGFWSWLGFGKKDEPKQDDLPAEQNVESATETLEQKVEQAEQKAEQLQETLEQKLEDLEDKIEDKFEQITSQPEIKELVDSVEQKAEQVEDFVERIEDAIEQKLEQIEEFVEQKSEQIEQFVEDKVEEAKSFLHETADKIEQSFEQEKEQSVSIIDTAKAEVTQDVEEVTVQAVEFSENLANETTTEPVNHHQQIEERVEKVVEAELAGEVKTKSDAEENFEELEELVELEAEKAEHAQAEQKADDYQEKPSEGGFFSRLLKGLVKTKQSIGSGFRNFFSGKKIDDDLFEELEEQLLVADLGMPTTTKIINSLTQHATKQQLKDADLLYQQLKVELGEVLKPVSQPLEIDTSKKPYVILMVGVNGVGKTTTIGKLARKFQAEGKSVMLAAGDTFRAAAVEQLQVWGERNNIPVVAQSTGSDSASVIFDAMQSAASKGIDILIADTAGRLQNKNNLMDELKKIVRVMKKYDESAPHEIMLTLDAGTGQNAISQAKLFNEAVGLTGITLTKLDGTAKGGVIFAIADQFNIPIRFIGVGEKIEDLRPFNAEEFIEALFEHEE
ncbi:signal recognition particle-docking protein FtsY [Actinobacillus equuli]|uniref:signal recognition particle-docking protein FtsY n=1 Tax=Actinobacillus equuli TaxID=718 RepID=UPI0024414B5E|nr:signal recognition particle-docking protein FtsY [Actinobacillus equuli]WGE42229.1 signal recognition particle-docking protein FtsY [Actinobacillus equuli subsp. haemolyticus]WGE69351.1 signal recognition particle-docking protein FtsY [Actinobacillus equuli subsp. haemolyticus]WGE71362.1 signal recognition particle-docking protein FtsY [Actinobacillus equuli subsp. haemolyticus]